jgi:hypothetical protein
MEKNYETPNKKSSKNHVFGTIFRQVFGQIYCSRAPGLTASIPICFEGGNYLKISESKSQQELIQVRAHTNN